MEKSNMADMNIPIRNKNYKHNEVKNLTVLWEAQGLLKRNNKG